MASLFFSHSNNDKAAAKRLGKTLEAKGFESLFISSDPEHRIFPGENWKNELYRQLKICDAVVFLMTKESCESKWCFAELAMAQAIGKPIFPVKLGEARHHELLRNVQRIDFVELGEDKGVEQLVHALKALLPISFAWDRQRSPYPGLEHFTEEDAGVFFSRESEIDKLVKLLQPILQSKKDRRLITVLGASGSGKSSLVLAGLIPRLKRTGKWVVIPRIVPKTQPLINLIRSLVFALKERGIIPDFDELLKRLQTAVGSDELIKEIKKLYTTSEQSALLFIDQAEELITSSGTEERKDFLNLLAEAITTEFPLWVVLTLRVEFFRSSQQQNELSSFISEGSSQFLVMPMERGRLRNVIKKPAEQAGIEFENNLINQIVDDTMGADRLADALPLLAYTLSEMYQRIRKEGRNRNTYSDYISTGGVLGAIKERADLACKELHRKDKKELIMPTLMKLVTIESDKSEPMRRCVFLGELNNEEMEIIQTFVNARLLKTDRDEEGAIVEVAHEALLRNWEPFQHEIKSRHEQLRMRSELERLIRDWERSRRHRSYLISDERLEKALRFIESYPNDLPKLQDFLKASSKEEFEREENKKRLEMQANLRQHSEEILDLLRVEPVQGLVQAIRAIGLNLDLLPDEIISTVQGTLYTAIAQSRERWWAIGHTSCIRKVAFSPDGKILASGSNDRTVRLWDLNGKPIGQPCVGHNDSVTSVTFSPDGKILASGSDDRTVRLWDLNGKPIGQPCVGHNDSVTSVTFSPDGKILASGSNDKTIRLWDCKGNAIGKEFVGHKSFVSSIAFSPSGKRILSGSGDHTICLWELNGSIIGQPIYGHNDFVTSVCFSPDGQTFASSSCDRTIRLWNLKGKPIGKPIEAHDKYVTDVVFSPDGQTLASSGGDNKLRLWQLDGTPIENDLVGHTDLVASFAFSPNGKLLASGGGDCTVRLWDRFGYQINIPIRKHTSDVDVVLSPSEQTIISSAGRTLQLWNLIDDKWQIRHLEGHKDYVYGLALSPDGQTIVSGSGDGTMLLWDLHGNRISEPFRGHEAEVTDVAFSADGRIIASASTDGTLLLWDLHGNQMSEPFRGHNGQVNAISLSGTGEQMRIVSGGSDKLLFLWDRYGNQLTNFSGHDAPVKSVTFCSNGQSLISGSADGTMRRWNLKGKSIITFMGHRDSVTSVALSSDGEIVLSASMDGTLRLWNLQGETLAEPLLGHQGAIWTAEFSRNGETIVSGGSDRTVRIWRGGNWRSWLRLGCHRLVEHPVFTQPTSKLESEAFQLCQRPVW
jgi:WD40 repeat protein